MTRSHEPVLRVLQLLPDSFFDPLHSGDGVRADGTCLDATRTANGLVVDLCEAEQAKTYSAKNRRTLRANSD